MNIEQEQFLNDTLVMAGFDPKEDDFEMLKEDMRPILDEYIELNLYKFLNEEQKAEYDKLKNKNLGLPKDRIADNEEPKAEPDELENKNLGFFKDRIANFDNILAELYINWQKDYLNYFNESED